MKHILITTIAAVVLVGCGESRPLSEADSALRQAITKGDIEAVKQHLAAGADVDAKDMNGETPLTWAANKEIAELLIAEGADVNARDKRGKTPLHYAKTKEIAELLIAKGADVNAKDKSESTPLHYAKTKEIAELLIAKGADVNARNKNNETPIDLARRKSTRILLRENGAEYSTIHYAARHGDLDMVKKFLTKGVDVNIKYGKNEWTPLLFAAPGHHKDVLELLISKGANVNATGKRKLTALHFAARGEKLEIVQLLVNNGANIEAEDLPEHGYWLFGVPKTPLDLAYGKTKTFLSKTVSKLRAKESLHGAVSDNDIQLVKQHLAAGANVNAKNEQGQTPIHLAAKTRKVKKEITELLIANNADVNVKAVDGATPLHLVKNKEVAELLIEKGADVNVKDRKGRTPLDFAVTGKRAETEELIRKNGGERGEYKMTIYQAASIGDLETVEKLLESGTDVNQKIRQGYTPLMAAGTKEIAEFLISKGASVNESTIFGTALHEAVNRRRYEVAKVLLENGASVDAKTNVGKTPLDMAIKWKQKKIADLLRKHGGKTGEELKAEGK
jgi:cytohesin